MCIDWLPIYLDTRCTLTNCVFLTKQSKIYIIFVFRIIQQKFPKQRTHNNSFKENRQDFLPTSASRTQNILFQKKKRLAYHSKPEFQCCLAPDSRLFLTHRLKRLREREQSSHCVAEGWSFVALRGEIISSCSFERYASQLVCLIVSVIITWFCGNLFNNWKCNYIY